MSEQYLRNTAYPSVHFESDMTVEEMDKAMTEVRRQIEAGIGWQNQAVNVHVTVVASNRRPPTAEQQARLDSAEACSRVPL